MIKIVIQGETWTKSFFTVYSLHFAIMALICTIVMVKSFFLACFATKIDTPCMDLDLRV